MTPLMIAAGAAAGGALRFLATEARGPDGGAGLPHGLLGVNVAASFVLGILAGAAVSGAVFAALGVGFCGGLSTWSSLAARVSAGDDGRSRRGIVHLVASVLLGIGAAAFGAALAR